MISLRNILFFIIGLNLLLVVVLYQFSFSDDQSATVTSGSDESIFLEKNEHGSKSSKKSYPAKKTSTKKSSKKSSYHKPASSSSKPKTRIRTITKTKYVTKVVHKVLKPKVSKEYQELSKKYATLRRSYITNGIAMRARDIFRMLGAYPTITRKYFNSFPQGKPFYNTYRYGVKKDRSYCALSDAYMLAHPENIFQKMNFFTDYTRTGLVRTQVMRAIGNDMMLGVTMAMTKKESKTPTFRLKPQINMFFTKNVNMHINYKSGEHFNCATQMYNHIPGHGVLKRKDLVVDSVHSYALRYKNQPQCFNDKMFFPKSYRLYIKSECKKFFGIINSNAYKKSLKAEPIQYLIKVGYGAHRASGVFLLDPKETLKMKRLYGSKGQKCGQSSKSLVAQTYVTNPLLLDLNNKFDFRVYMLVASTNPTIVFYHDGFLRVSLKTYNKNSNDRTTHLTNTHLSKKIFAQAKDGLVNGKTEAELRDYQMWTLPELEQYLFESGKVTDPNWLTNYLRPQFQRAFIHSVRMSESAFWKGSNVFEMFGLDFMLDDNLNLWFIECNSSPQLIGTNPMKTKFLVTMLSDLFEIEFAYYRSRMKRVYEIFNKINTEVLEKQQIDFVKWQKEYKKAVYNVLEPEYNISENNSFIMIMDRGRPGKDKYLGYLQDECIDD
jgi:hypothetical protein